VQPGQGVIWSTGPDRADNAAQRDGDSRADDDPEWTRGQYDLVKLVPRWP
jgi:hypothetical protein